MSTIDGRREILTALVDQLPFYPFTGAWAFLTGHDDVRCPPADPRAALAALRERFADEAIRRAGVAQCDGQGELAFTAPLAATEGPIVVLRDRDRGRVLDVLSPGTAAPQTLAAEASAGPADHRGELPLFTALAGQLVRLGTRARQHTVLVAMTIDDVAVLRACGLPATLVTGLDRLLTADVARLCREFALERQPSARHEELEIEYPEPCAAEDDCLPTAPADQPGPAESPAGDPTGDEPDNDEPDNDEPDNDEPDNDEPAEAHGDPAGDLPDRPADRAEVETPLAKQLVFVAWSPAALDGERPAGFAAVTRHFRELDDYMGLDRSAIQFWQPTAASLDRIRFFAHREEVAAVREALLDSLYEDTWLLESTDPETETEDASAPDDLPAAYWALREALRGDRRDHSTQAVRQAAERLQRLLQAELIGPMMTEAANSPTASEQALGVVTALLAELFIMDAVGVQARLAEWQHAAGPIDGQDPLARHVQQLISVADSLNKFFREMQRCRESSAHAMVLPQVSPAVQRALPTLG